MIPRTLLFSTLGLCFLGISATLAVRKVNSAPTAIRENEGFWAALRYRERPEKPFIAADRKRMRAWKERMRNDLLAAFPQLRLETREIADGNNGFLSLIRLKNFMSESEMSRFRDEMAACLETWDLESAQAFVERWRHMAEEAERIAKLPNTSSILSEEDYPSAYFSAGEAKNLLDLLNLQTRIFAETSDSESAYKSWQQGRSIQSHLFRLDRPSMLTETVYVLCELDRMKIIFDHILPAYGTTADLPYWREQFVEASFDRSRFAHVLRGEWNTTLDMALRTFFLDNHNGGLPDPKATAFALAAGFARSIEKLETPRADSTGVSEIEFHTAGLSKEGAKTLEVMSTGTAEWGKGYQRAETLQAQYLAAMDWLIYERHGGEPPAAIEPATGLPFDFDLVRRLILPPVSELLPEDVGPLKLPF